MIRLVLLILGSFLPCRCTFPPLLSSSLFFFPSNQFAERNGS
uniref:Uncharacterized protein n=1 Tax=Arundo donax TaxID=35708 RepID=A0A0A9C205_ARUDO